MVRISNGIKLKCSMGFNAWTYSSGAISLKNIYIFSLKQPRKPKQRTKWQQRHDPKRNIWDGDTIARPPELATHAAMLWTRMLADQLTKQKSQTIKILRICFISFTIPTISHSPIPSPTYLAFRDVFKKEKEKRITFKDKKIKENPARVIEIDMHWQLALLLSAPPTKDLAPTYLLYPPYVANLTHLVSINCYKEDTILMQCNIKVDFPPITWRRSRKNIWAATSQHVDIFCLRNEINGLDQYSCFQILKISEPPLVATNC